MAMKNGFVAVLVIRVTDTGLSPPPLALPPAVLLPPPPQAARASVAELSSASGIKILRASRVRRCMYVSTSLCPPSQ